VRVAFNDHIFSWQKYGGISRYFFELATELSCDPSMLVRVISPLHVNEYFEFGQKHIFKGYKAPSGNLLEKGYRLVNRTFSPLIRRNFNPDIFHETYYSKGSESIGRAKRVLTVFDMIHEKLPQYFDPKDKTPMRKAAAVKRADHIICISESTRRDLIEILNVSYEKTSVVRLGYSFNDFQDKAQLDDLPSTFLLYVGQRSGYKNFSSLLDVYANNAILKNNFQLIAFGGGQFTQQEKNKLASYGLGPSKIRQINGGDSVLKQLYRNASLFIYPSHYEGFGIPPLEAMSMGCPVACSDTSSLPEVAGDGAVFFDPGCQESMTNAILKCLGDDSFRRMLACNGRIRAEQFSWDKCAKETKEIYTKLLLLNN
jgi:glycosyltransferase involved in cell wall biosynthesis